MIGARLIQNHVVIPLHVRRAECRANGGLTKAGGKGVDRQEILGCKIALPADLQASPLVAVQSDDGLAAELAPALLQSARIRTEPSFQDEPGFPAVTEIFGAEDTETRAILDAVDRADGGDLELRARDLRIANPRIDYPVKGNRRLRMCGDRAAGGKACDQCERGAFLTAYFHFTVSPD
jgi:hypothetical protein